MTADRWILRLEGRNLELRLNPESEWLGAGRCSPIFPASVVTPPFVPNPSKTWYVTFYWPYRAFDAVESTVSRFESMRFDGLSGSQMIWFSFGLASLLVIEPFKEMSELVLERINGDQNLACFERWEVPPVRGAETKVRVEPGPGPEYPPPDHEATLTQPLFGSRATQLLHYDLVPATQRLRRQVQVYAPSATSAVESFLRRVEIPFSVLARDGQPHDVYQRATGDLGELHHALSHVLAQGYTGTWPLLEHPGVTIGHTLLGIGRGLQAIQAIEDHYTRAFTSQPVREVLSDIAAMPPFQLQNEVAVHFPSHWPIVPENEPDPNFLVDSTHLPVYLSMRRGFRETPQSLTAPPLSLPQSASKDWHIVTLSHELLHSYVRGLLATLFGQIDLKGLFERFAETQGVDAENALDSFRYAILASTARLHEAYLEGQRPTGKLAALTTAPEIERAFYLHYEDLQELMVHKLDYLYTYAPDSDYYLESAWRTWTTVPVAETRVPIYVLRTLLAVTPLHEAEPSDDISENELIPFYRFRDVLQQCRSCFQDNIIKGNHPLLTQAKAVIDDLYKFQDPHHIRIKYIKCLFISDLVERFIFRGHIRSALAESGTPYLGDLCSFKVSPHCNPISLMKATFQAPTEFDSERTSAWQLLLLSDFGGKPS